jgi:PAS domain S-box-containing protein
MESLLSNIFRSDYLPHGHCYFWDPQILALQVFSNGVIALSYFSIPIALVYLAVKRKEIQFNWVVTMFALFILLCGLTHILGIWTIWYGTYKLDTLIKLLTALASAGTAIVLWKLVPQALHLPDIRLLKEQLKIHQNTQRRWQNIEKTLESQVQQKSEELQFSRACYESFVAATTSIICSLDRDGRFVSVQQSWEDYTGQKKSEYQSRGWLQMIHPNDRAKVEHLWDSLSNGVQETQGSVWSKSHNQFRYSHIRAVPQVVGETAVAGWAMMITDIHDHRLAEEKFRLAVEAAPNAMIMVDEKGTIVLVNSETENLFGFSRTELMGNPVEILLPKRLQKDHPYFRSSYMLAPEKRSMGAGRELFASHRDGREIPVEIGLNPIQLGEERYVMSSIVDLTYRRRAEEQEHHYAVELERSNRELDQFAYIASHDLKAPLRAIENLAKWIAQDAEAVLPPDSKRHLKQLEQRTKRMEQLLNDLLEYSRAGRVHTALENIDLRSLLEEITELLAPPAEFHFIFELSVPLLYAKKVPLTQVLRNLIGNAIKHHNRKDGTITVRCHERNPFVEFEIVDDGPGVAPQYHEKIFEMFKTLRPRDEVEGSGMGLAIVKKIIENEGGAISVDSEEGKGCTFRFTWPRTAPESTSPSRKTDVRQVPHNGSTSHSGCLRGSIDSAQGASTCSSLTKK